MELKGVYTALVTPFANGAVDLDCFRRLIEFQIAGQVDGVLPMGTTGESPTVSFEEHSKIIETAIEAVAGRCQVIAGTGANSTAEAVHLTKLAKAAGADATLQVTPYYNKPTQEGLYRHFSTVADEGGLPVILYNVPGRSGVPIAIDTIARLSKNSNVVAVKEAGGSTERVSAILDACDITVLSGDDSLTLPMLSVGATGIISVASNLIPAEVKAMVEAFMVGNIAEATRLHRKYYCFFRDIFVETNPIPIKTAMAIKGMLQEEFRLPLCEIGAAGREVLLAAMRKSGIL